MNPQVTDHEIEYPDSDGQPMADNTLQFRWIVTLEGCLDAMFRDDPNVFVAGDLLWYPVEGRPEIRVAPDALVAFGRPKGYRGSYQQWQEDDIPPQVVFEVLSPGNTPRQMEHKRDFYDRYGVEEYYLYDPYDGIMNAWIRRGDHLELLGDCSGWTSPRLGVRFELGSGELEVFDDQGRPFATFVEWIEKAERAVQDRDAAIGERDQAIQERERMTRERDQVLAVHAETERQRLKADERAKRLAEKLRELGVDPDEL